MGKRDAGSPRTRTSIPPASEGGGRIRPRTSIPPAIGRRVVETTVATAAMKVFARRGYANARVEDILEEAGIARRTFYRYFTSKDDVLVLLYEIATTDLLRLVKEAADAQPDPFAGLKAALDRYLAFHVENATICRVIMPFLVGGDSPVVPARRRFRAEILQLLVRNAELRGLAPVEGFTYVAVVSALQGVAMELLEPCTNADDVDRAKRALHRLVEHGLR